MAAAGTGLENTATGRGARAHPHAPGTHIVTGARVPWGTLLGGLQAYRGILGWNGRGVLAAGAIVALGGAASLVGRAGLLVRRGVSLLAALVGGASAVLVVRLIATWHDLVARDAMMVARPGVGLPVVVAGAIVAAAAMLFEGGR